jgi:flagellar hook protein FlgE
VQSDVQSNSIGTFMAINGDGFFVVSKPSSFTDNKPVFDGIDRYTRRGDFQPDKNGFLVNGAGYYLMGSVGRSDRCSEQRAKPPASFYASRRHQREHLADGHDVGDAGLW